MDLSESITPKSDQQNFDDYLTGPRTVTISAVKQGSPEQPVSVELVEYPGRPFKPNKSMRRVLVAAWGADSTAYVGRGLVLFGNPKVIYGGKAVGGIEIAEMSHLDKPLTLALTETRGKKRSFTVKPLAKPAAVDPLAIPERVLVAAPEAIEAGKGDAYLEYLTSNGAPAHIVEFVTDLIKDAAKEQAA